MRRAGARPGSGGGERKDKPATIGEPVEPRRVRRRDSGMDEHGVALAGIERGAVAGMHGQVRAGREIFLCPGGNRGIDFDGDNVSLRSNHLGHNCRVISDAAADMKHSIAHLLGWILL
jgi:hypothetical protein